LLLHSISIEWTYSSFQLLISSMWSYVVLALQ
jgi:hypothetical protein